MLQTVFRHLDRLYPDMVAWRRHFHMHPELSFQEVETPKRIAELQRSFGLAVREGVGGRGVVAVLEGAAPGPTVALRADFDALPIQDEKEVPYRSQVPGVMHAYGHDAHTAILLGVARALSAVRNQLPGRVVFIHQFAEEVTPGGAKAMIEDGCLEGVDVIFGTHVWSGLPLGTIGYREGPMMAAADAFRIVVQGRGGHGAAPHETVDAIAVGAQLVSMLQQVVARRVDPVQPAVVTVGSFHAGSAFNVIAEQAVLEGTARSFDEGVRNLLEREIERVVQGVCAAASARYSYTYTRGYPALVNHERETRLLVDTLSQVYNANRLVRMDPIMGGEDFAYYLQKVPGTFFFTGAGNPQVGASYPHHHPRFDIDERAMAVAAKALAALTLRTLCGDGVLDGARLTLPEASQPVIA
ncbi:amidohydrolase [Calditerricola satsumensis]|uniref:Putative amidohydrolase YhaA n=1 Tax=Calditerricola satsumensis TaxID=373054 RepID=A0A8J3FCM0_9BACI|nr:amidohydrolase [Calditerricola satsumensis]GGK06886.1 putative amidohydrolase YhaA [Calditerricola satsumensis]